MIARAIADRVQEPGVIDGHDDVIGAGGFVANPLLGTGHRRQNNGPGTPGHEVCRGRGEQIPRREDDGVSGSGLRRARSEDDPAGEGFRQPEGQHPREGSIANRNEDLACIHGCKCRLRATPPGMAEGEFLAVRAGRIPLAADIS